MTSSPVRLCQTKTLDLLNQAILIRMVSLVLPTPYP